MDARVDERFKRPIPDQAQMEDLLQDLMRGINKLALDETGGKSEVLFGPFAGMVIPTAEEESWADGNYSTKLLGCYEHELYEAIHQAVSRKPRYVLNVGCGDGYYAVGLARLLPMTVISAFDVSAACLATCDEFAKRNGVGDRVHPMDGCRSAAELRLKSVGGHRLYIVDCEGDELVLLDPKACPELVHSDIIVECHDFLHPHDISLRLAARFANTHAVDVIRPRLPMFARYDFLNKTPGITQVLMCTEKRPMPTLWLACWANDRG